MERCQEVVVLLASPRHVYHTAPLPAPPPPPPRRTPPLPPTLTIALRVTPTGRQGGVPGRSSGVVRTMVRVALARDAGQSAQLLLHTIATQATPIGWLGGASRRRIGAARMEGKVARLLLEGALEQN